VIDVQAAPGVAPGVWNGASGGGVGVGCDVGDSVSVAVAEGVSLAFGVRDTVADGDGIDAEGPLGAGVVEPPPHPPSTTAIRPATRSPRTEPR
jgi:hypothetical protein